MTTVKAKLRIYLNYDRILGVPGSQVKLLSGTIPVAQASACVVLVLAWINPQRLKKLRQSVSVISSEARDLLFFAKQKKQQIPRANTALLNDSF
jgi:hypothetical protein